ncbi:MAG: hypothetical protein KC620_20985, partial [Myxococcales bacterium]|nr:hypothetical protein [Myxococcales bacterium]
AYGMFEAPPYNRVQALNFEPMASLYAEAGACLDRFEAGETTAAEAQDAIIGLIEQSGLGPAPWHLTDRSKRYPTTFTLPNLIEYMQWGRTASPPSVRNTYFGGGKGDASAWFQWVSTMLLDELQRQGQAASARSVDYLRESLQPLPWRGGHTP